MKLGEEEKGRGKEMGKMDEMKGTRERKGEMKGTRLMKRGEPEKVRGKEMWKMGKMRGTRKSKGTERGETNQM